MEFLESFSEKFGFRSVNFPQIPGSKMPMEPFPRENVAGTPTRKAFPPRIPSCEQSMSRWFLVLAAAASGASQASRPPRSRPSPPHTHPATPSPFLLPRLRPLILSKILAKFSCRKIRVQSFSGFSVQWLKALAVFLALLVKTALFARQQKGPYCKRDTGSDNLFAVTPEWRKGLVHLKEMVQNVNF